MSGPLTDRIAARQPAPVVAWPARAPQPLLVEAPKPIWIRRNESGENRGKVLSERAA